MKQSTYSKIVLYLLLKLKGNFNIFYIHMYNCTCVRIEEKIEFNFEF